MGERDRMQEEIKRIERVSQKALDKVIEETEVRLQEVLEQKIRNAKSEHREKLEDEKSRAEEDGERMIADDKKDLKAKCEKRIRNIREDGEKDIDYLREKRDAIRKRVSDKEGRLADAKKRLASLQAGDSAPRNSNNRNDSDRGRR